MSKETKNNILAEKLKDLKLDYSAYGRLPMQLDVLAITVPDDKPKDSLTKQLDKLRYIRQHLQKIDDYIKSETKDPINVWDSKNGGGLSTKVLSELKGHNNETGGVSAYFYNLQVIYDEQEALYDSMESQSKAPADAEKMLLTLRNERGEKRKTRAVERKIMVKDLKKDGKGYLYIETESGPSKEDKEAEEKKSADGEKAKEEEIVNKETEIIKKSTKKVGIYVAGFMVFVTLVAVTVAAMREED